MAIYPTPEQLETLLSSDDDDQPVVMINLLRFKAQADAPDDALTGEEAYRRYGAQMIPHVTSKGGRFLWSGRIDAQVIGDGGEDFTMALLVEYPSRKAFVEINSEPYVQEIQKDRVAGLHSQWLLATTTETI